MPTLYRYTFDPNPKIATAMNASQVLQIRWVSTIICKTQYTVTIDHPSVIRSDVQEKLQLAPQDK